MAVFGFKKDHENSSHAFYWQYFGLIKNPFNAELDVSDAYITSAWEQYLDLLHHWLANENTIGIILGIKGIGKSIFIQLFYMQIHDSVFAHLINGKSKFTLESFMNTLYERFDLSNNSSETIEEKLDDLITQMQFKEKPCVLLIDDADDLPEDCIFALTYLIKQQSKNQMRFHAFLAGGVELQAKLAKVAQYELTPDFLKAIELQAYNLEDTRKYIIHRLLKAGLRSALPFSDETFLRIYEMSHGQPEDINHASQEILIDELDRQKAETTPSLIQTYQTHLIGAGVIMGVLIVLGFLLMHESQPVKKSTENSTSTPSINFAVSNQPKPINQVQTHVQAQNMPAPLANSSNSNGVENLNKNTMPSAPSNIPLAAAPVTNHNPLQQKPVDSPSSQPQAIKNIKPQNLPTQNSVMPSSNQPAVTQSLPTPPEKLGKLEANSAKAMQPSQPIMADAGNNPSEITTDPQAEETPKDKVSAEAETQKTEPSKKSMNLSKQHPKAHKTPVEKKKNFKDTSTSNKAVAAKGAYTLQLAALGSQSAVKKMIEQYHLGPKAHTTTREVNGKMYYVLLYGSYASAEQAKNAKTQLPEAFKNKAWLRKESQ